MPYNFLIGTLECRKLLAISFNYIALLGLNTYVTPIFKMILAMRLFQITKTTKGEYFKLDSKSMGIIVFSYPLMEY